MPTTPTTAAAIAMPILPPVDKPPELPELSPLLSPGCAPAELIAPGVPVDVADVEAVASRAIVAELEVTVLDAEELVMLEFCNRQLILEIIAVGLSILPSLEPLLVRPHLMTKHTSILLRT
jgi:hypothetical protein